MFNGIAHDINVGMDVMVRQFARIGISNIRHVGIGRVHFPGNVSGEFSQVIRHNIPESVIINRIRGNAVAMEGVIVGRLAAATASERKRHHENRRQRGADECKPVHRVLPRVDTLDEGYPNSGDLSVMNEADVTGPVK